ncbi:MAG: AbrB/MazE/SpoVT family DNA-binding domain-containing protein [Chloroflexota bacterium]
MAVRQRIVRIGNSRGVRLPAHLLAEAHLGEGDEVELSLEADRIVLRAAHRPRAGWSEQFSEMAKHGDDRLLDGDRASLTSWDDEEWRLDLQSPTMVPISETS